MEEVFVQEPRLALLVGGVWMIDWVIGFLACVVVAGGLFGVVVTAVYVWGRWREVHPRPEPVLVDEGACRVPSRWVCACGSRFRTFEKGQEHVEVFHGVSADVMLTGVVE